MDAEEHERFCRELQTELLGLDVARVEPAPAEASANTRDAGSFDWASLLVALSSPDGVLPIVLSTIQDWLRRHGRERGTRSGSVTVRLSDDCVIIAEPTPAQQQQLIDAFLDRHRGSG